MKILLYSWGSVCEPGLLRAIEACGNECLVFKEKMADYHADGGFSKKLIDLIHKEKIEMIVSYDYFPLVSLICDVNHLPYAAWVYDCPQYTLYSKTIGNECNYLFCFDEWLTAYVRKLGAKHAYHMMLGSDAEGFAQALKAVGEGVGAGAGAAPGAGVVRDAAAAVGVGAGVGAGGKKPGDFSGDIAFVGSLYESYEEKLWEKTGYSRGFLEGLIEAQKKIYGYNVVSEVLPEFLVDEIADKLQLGLGEMYFQDKRQMAVDAIGRAVTYRERVDALVLLGKHWQVRLYSGSPLPEKLKGLKVVKEAYIDYMTQMPRVFQNSKINLNITAKTIPSGIPQRVLDILSCGGFCLTNYQPEIAEVFEDGAELVMYESLEDMVGKVDFYLNHQEERNRIREAGYQRVLRDFTLTKQWKKITEMLPIP